MPWRHFRIILFTVTAGKEARAARRQENVMPSKSVLFLVTHSAAGGAGEIMANIAEGFVARGHEVTLAALYPHPNSHLDTRLPWRHIVAERPGPLGAAKLGSALIGYLKRQRPDILITALPAANVMGAAGAWLARSGTRVYITHHSPSETHSALLNLADNISGGLPSVRKVVSVSDAVASSLDGKPQRYRAKRRTIHNALPPVVEAQLVELARAHQPRVARRRAVVAVGRLADQKNYPVLLRAAAHLTDVTVEIVGEGDQGRELRAMAQDLGLGDRVTFHGRLSRTRTLEILADGDILVQPSLFEGHSLALVEAAKLDLPLIVSDVPTQIEGVTARDGTRCGVVVPLHDDRALASAILRILNDTETYRTYADLASKLAAEADFGTMVDSYEQMVAETHA